MCLGVTAVHTEEGAEPIISDGSNDDNDNNDDKSLENVNIFELIVELFKSIFASIGIFF